ncbi:MAG: hypothetical protein LAT67_03930 [Balneolales bacterium]|nr:hypothetical protein [Balneolales bacterium]
MITFFNLRFMGSQQQKFVERIGDGSEIYALQFTSYETGQSLSPSDFSDMPVVLLFWATWSGRSLDAINYLSRVRAETGTDVMVIAIAVKDNREFIEEFFELENIRFEVVDGTEHYNEIRIPGLPSLLLYEPGGRLHGVKFGFSGTEDYAFVRNYLSK